VGWGKWSWLASGEGWPLKDVSLLERVELVMKDGKVYKGAGAASCAQGAEATRTGR
jgi:hypothetical protein